MNTFHCRMVKQYLTDEEYKSYSLFMSYFCNPVGSVTVKTKVNHYKYKDTLMCLNVYSIKDVIDIAKYRINVHRAGELRKQTLTKLINILEGKQCSKN